MFTSEFNRANRTGNNRITLIIILLLRVLIHIFNNNADNQHIFDKSIDQSSIFTYRLTLGMLTM